MPTYHYSAKSFKGEVKKGVLEAKDKKSLARTLRNQGFILTSASSKEKKKLSWSSLPLIGGVSLKDKIFFTRNLKVMIGAGMSLPKALTVLKKQTKSRTLKRVLKEMANKVIKGRRFSDCLKDYPKVFPEIYCSMVKVGEETGNLGETLGNLAFQMERSHELRSKVKGAMIYPSVIITAMIGIGILMLVMVVPKLAETFEELGVELPPTTRFVIGLGSFLSQNFYLLIIAFLIVLILFRAALKTKPGKKALDTVLLRIPVISRIIIKTNSASFSRSLAILTGSGVPIVKSLEIISDSLSNFYFKEDVKQASNKVKKGAKLSESLSKEVYPSLVIQMIKVGEETGETVTVLGKLADFFEEEVTRSTENLAAVVEPVLMIIIGAVVGFFAISMIQPMYSMLGTI